MSLNRFSSNFGHLKYPLVAFLTVLAIRTIPEMLMGPYPLGFDTVAYYIPITMQWLKEGVDFWQAMTMAPLFYALLTFVTAIGIPIILSLKIIPPLLHAFLALTIYYYANKALKWSPRKSLLTSLLATLYFVALRVSWDMLRNQLGLIFLFLTLALSYMVLNKGDIKWKHYVLLSLVAILTVLAHQLVAALMLIIFITLITSIMLKGERAKVKSLIIALTPAAILFFTFNAFALVTGAEAIINTSTSPLPFQSSISNFDFFLYCYLPLLPLSIMGIIYFRDVRMNSWTLWIFFTLLIPLIFPSMLGLGGHRWTFMLVYPLAFLVIEALDKLKPSIKHKVRCIAYGAVLLAFISLVAWLSIGFMIKSPESPISYFDPQQQNRHIFYIQSSMLQNTMSVENIPDFTKAITWLDANHNNNSALVIPNQFYGLALITVKSPMKIIDTVELTPFNPNGEQILISKCLETLNSGDSVYTVWWAPHHSWYGISFPLEGFVEEQGFGTFSVYRFSVV